jgi:hypothetical protein
MQGSHPIMSCDVCVQAAKAELQGLTERVKAVEEEKIRTIAEIEEQARADLQRQMEALKAEAEAERVRVAQVGRGA